MKKNTLHMTRVCSYVRFNPLNLHFNVDYAYIYAQ